MQHNSRSIIGTQRTAEGTDSSMNSEDQSPQTINDKLTNIHRASVTPKSSPDEAVEMSRSTTKRRSRYEG